MGPTPLDHEDDAMTADQAGSGGSGGSASVSAGFGSCCEAMKDAIAGDDFEPLFTVGDDGVLYMAVGLVNMEEDGEEEEPGMIDHPVFHCPFCGTKLQTPDEVERKSGGPVS